MSPIEVLVLTTSYPLEKNPVSGIFVKQLIENLPPEFKPIVVTPSDQSKHLKDKNNIVECRYAPRRLQILAHQPGGIPEALKTNKTKYMLVLPLLTSMLFYCLALGKNSQVIHANWAICGLIAGLANILLRKTLITTLRGEDVNRAEKSRIAWLTLKTCIKLSDAIVCVSSAHQDELTKLFASQKNKILHIPNGVSNELMTIKRLPETKKRIKVLTIGSLISRKNISTIIEAVKKCKNRKRIHLKIIGDGPLRRELEALSKSYQINVEFSGQIQFKKIIHEYQDADIFVLASKSEGRPNVMLEAMASGLPSICSLIPGTDEVISHDVNGFLFKQGEISELAKLIDTLCNSANLRHNIGQNARAYIKENQLNWIHTGNNYSALYKSFLDKKQ